MRITRGGAGALPSNDLASATGGGLRAWLMIQPAVGVKKHHVIQLGSKKLVVVVGPIPIFNAHFDPKAM